MSRPVPEFAFEQLVQHEHFVRKALRGLLRDDDRVDDAMQETWLRGMQRPRAVPAEPGPWLLRVAKNLAVGGWRSERRRARREAAIATPAEAESPETSQRRVEMRQRVVAAILALGEPYRSVVLLRYEQDLDASAIAQRLDRSPATVRSQLSRAHDLLRARLDGEFGGRERWAVLATPLLRSAAATPGAGVFLAAGLLVAGGGLAWLVYPREPGFAPVDAAHAGATAAPGVVAAAPSVGGEALAAASPQRSVVEVPQDPAPGQGQRVELKDRSYFDDYEAATFSFEHGVRDDPDLSITHNDWDLMFDRGEFRVRMVVDDHSVIADLGKLEPRGFGAFAGTVDLREVATVEAGHAYFVSTRDSDTDLASVVFVRAHEQGRTCRFEWFTTDGERAQGSMADAGVGRPWIEVLAGMRAQQFRGRELPQPQARLQLRAGAGGGNPNRIDLAGDSNAYVRVRSKTPIDVVTPAAMSDRSTVYSEGGMIPSGREFVVTRVDYAGGNPGDSNGHGSFRVVVAGTTIVDVPPSSAAIAGSWEGRIAVAPGAESATYFEVANSSWGEVRMFGEFVAMAGKRGFGGRNAGFLSEARKTAVPPPPALEQPRVHLQVRAAAVGGNSCRIDLRGRTSLHVGRTASAPLDFASPLPEGEHSVAFAEGGLLAAGRVFVVTQVTWSGAAVGDSNGHGAFRLVVAGTRVVDAKSSPEPLAGEWTGRIEVVPGEETRTYLEVANSSHGDVLLVGHFEAR